VKWSTIRAKCLAAWLYAESSGLALPRKAKIAERYLAWYPKKTPERGTITERMREIFSAYLGRRRDLSDDTSVDIRPEMNYFGDNDENFVQSQFSLE
jgi:hypothetical protein